MHINLRVETHDGLITKRTELMLEAEMLLKKITALNTRYGSKITKLRKQILELEKKLC